MTTIGSGQIGAGTIGGRRGNGTASPPVPFEQAQLSVALCDMMGNRIDWFTQRRDLRVSLAFMGAASATFSIGADDPLATELRPGEQVVKVYYGGTIVLAGPLVRAPLVGDANGERRRNITVGDITWRWARKKFHMHEYPQWITVRGMQAALERQDLSGTTTPGDVVIAGTLVKPAMPVATGMAAAAGAIAADTDIDDAAGSPIAMQALEMYGNYSEWRFRPVDSTDGYIAILDCKGLSDDSQYGQDNNVTFFYGPSGNVVDFELDKSIDEVVSWTHALGPQMGKWLPEGWAGSKSANARFGMLEHDISPEIPSHLSLASVRNRLRARARTDLSLHATPRHYLQMTVAPDSVKFLYDFDLADTIHFRAGDEAFTGRVSDVELVEDTGGNVTTTVVAASREPHDNSEENLVSGSVRYR